MRVYKDNNVIEFIKERYLIGEVPSLRKIAKIFNTSHAQIKRILKRNGFWEEYLRMRNSIIEKDKIKTFNSFKYKDKKDLKLDFKVGVMCDIHLGKHIPELVESVVYYLKNENINKLVLLGDIFDGSSVSYWKNKDVTRIKEEIEMMKEFLSWIRAVFGNKVEIIYINGNHDWDRIERFLITNAKQFVELDLLKFENIFELDKFNIKFYSNKELLINNKQPFSIGNLTYLHGHEVKMNYSVVNIARTMFLKTYTNVIFGHFHTTQEYVFRNLRGEVLGAWSVGCLCELNADYMPVNNWNHGFAIVDYFTNGMFSVRNKKVINNVIL